MNKEYEYGHYSHSFIPFGTLVVGFVALEVGDGVLGMASCSPRGLEVESSSSALFYSMCECSIYSHPKR